MREFAIDDFKWKRWKFSQITTDFPRFSPRVECQFSFISFLPTKIGIKLAWERGSYGLRMIRRIVQTLISVNFCLNNKFDNILELQNSVRAKILMCLDWRNIIFIITNMFVMKRQSRIAFTKIFVLQWPWVDKWKIPALDSHHQKRNYYALGTSTF